MPKGNLSVLVSPKSIEPGQVFRIVITSEKLYSQAMVKVKSPAGSLDVIKQRKSGGPPYWWIATLRAEEAGIHQVWLENGTSRLIEKTFFIGQKKQTRNPSSYIWKTLDKTDRKSLFGLDREVIS